MKAMVCTKHGRPEVLQLREMVEAHKNVETGHKKGNVVISVVGAGKSQPN